jgi:hypothetical protein
VRLIQELHFYDQVQKDMEQEYQAEEEVARHAVVELDDEESEALMEHLHEVYRHELEHAGHHERRGHHGRAGHHEHPSSRQHASHHERAGHNEHSSRHEHDGPHSRTRHHEHPRHHSHASRPTRQLFPTPSLDALWGFDSAHDHALDYQQARQQYHMRELERRVAMLQSEDEDEDEDERQERTQRDLECRMARLDASREWGRWF